MEFFVNSEKVDITIEAEENVADLIQSFQTQMEPGFMVVSLLVNGENFDPLSETLAEYPLTDVKKIELEVNSSDNVAISLLQESRQILLNIAEDLRANGYQHESEFQELLDWVRQAVEAISKTVLYQMMESRVLISTIDQVKQYFQSEEREDARIEMVAGILENLVQYLESIYMKLASNFETKKEDVIKAIDQGIEILPEISEAFQVGNDKDAISRILMILNLLESCAVYLKKNADSLAVERDSVDSVYQELNELLNEIMEAFEQKDYVLIGDLIEYELPDKLESYKEILGE